MKEGFSAILRVNWTFFIIYQTGERKIWRHLDVLKKYILVDPGTPNVEGFFFSLGKGMLSQTALLIVADMHVMLSSLKKRTVYLVVQFNNTDHFTVAQKYARQLFWSCVLYFISIILVFFKSLKTASEFLVRFKVRQGYILLFSSPLIGSGLQSTAHKLKGN